jgi:hypothetical protein
LVFQKNENTLCCVLSEGKCRCFTSKNEWSEDVCFNSS